MKKKGVIKMRVLEGKLVASGLKVGIVAARRYRYRMGTRSF